MSSPAPSPPDDDFERVRAFLAGDAQAAVWIAGRLDAARRMVAGLCRRFRLPLTRDQVDDIGHDVILIALRKLAQLPRHVPLDAWLHRMCSYELANALRRQRRRASAELPGDVTDAAAGALERLERQELVLAALEALHAQDATVVRQHLFDGLTFVEIATRLGVTENLVKGRYYRAMAQLAITLRHHDPGRDLQ
ncbi:MAG: sigma-70 family RNA polymerase sigma factor [Planctomycetes bacterium]|nr:sigma-70 family RNA polymerase sigma factor [Planctomycetota bacterium]